MVPGLTSVEAALGIEHQPVRGLRPRAELRARPGVGVIPQDAVARDMGEQEGLAVPGRPFRSAPVGARDQFECPLAHVLPSYARMPIDSSASRVSLDTARCP